MRKSIAAATIVALAATLAACSNYNVPRNPNAVSAPTVQTTFPTSNPNPNPNTTPSPSVTYVNSNDHDDLEWAYEVCRYGAQQFYLARGIAIPETLTFAIRDCDKNLEFHGIDNFIIFYSPIPH